MREVVPCLEPDRKKVLAKWKKHQKGTKGKKGNEKEQSRKDSG